MDVGSEEEETGREWGVETDMVLEIFKTRMWKRVRMQRSLTACVI